MQLTALLMGKEIRHAACMGFQPFSGKWVLGRNKQNDDDYNHIFFEHQPKKYNYNILKSIKHNEMAYKN